MSEDAFRLAPKKNRLESQEMRASRSLRRQMRSMSGAAPWSTTANWIKPAMECMPNGITALNRAVAVPPMPWQHNLSCPDRYAVLGKSRCPNSWRTA